MAFGEWMDGRTRVDWRAGARWCTTQKLAALGEGGGALVGWGGNLQSTVLGEGGYRVFFFTDTPPKSSKYRKVNLG